MFFMTSLRLVVPMLICFPSILAASVEEGQNSLCMQIGASISSSSDVYCPGANSFTPHYAITPITVLIGVPLYAKGVHHWANYTSQAARCVVEPGTAADFGIIIENSCLK